MRAPDARAYRSYDRAYGIIYCTAYSNIWTNIVRARRRTRCTQRGERDFVIRGWTIARGVCGIRDVRDGNLRYVVCRVEESAEPIEIHPWRFIELGYLASLSYRLRRSARPMHAG